MKNLSASLPILVTCLVAGTAWSQVIENVSFDPEPGTPVRPGQQIKVDFQYSLGGHTEALIFLVPLSSGIALEGADARSLRVTNQHDKMSAWFTVREGPAHVDALMFRVIDGRFGETLVETRVPSRFEFQGKKTFGAIFAKAIEDALKDVNDQHRGTRPERSASDEGSGRLTQCTGNCEEVSRRDILPDGTVTLECADGSSRTTLPDGERVNRNPSGERCVLLFTQSTQIPRIEEPPGEWVASVGHWITNANDVLLGSISVLAGPEATENYREFENSEVSGPYEQADLRLRYLEKLTEVH